MNITVFKKQTVENQGSARLSRRGLLRKAAALAAAVIAGGAIVAGGVADVAAQDDVSAAAVGHFRTTSSLNLRSGPGTNYSVIKVLPPQTLLAAVGPEASVWVKVSSQGTVGWVHSAFLTISNGGSSDTPVPLGTKYATASVNMRKGPGTSYPVLNVIPQGTAISVYDGFQSNYQLVSYNGAYGWVSLDYLAANPGQPAGQARTTTAVNLRVQPTLHAPVVRVLPAGTYVLPGDQIVNSFRQVTHNGVTGWVWDAYLV